MNHVKKCLHYDPDSKPCKKVHKTLRGLQKDTDKARGFVETHQWRQAVKILDGPGGLLARFESAFDEAMSSEGYLSERIPAASMSKVSSQARLDLYGLALKAGIGANDFGKRTSKWSDIVLEMDEDNVDALVAKGERQLKDESWDQAVQTFNRAFELTGQSSQDVRSFLLNPESSFRADSAGKRSIESCAETLEGIETEGLLQGHWRVTRCRRQDDQESLVR